LKKNPRRSKMVEAESGFEIWPGHANGLDPKMSRTTSRIDTLSTVKVLQ